MDQANLPLLQPFSNYPLDCDLHGQQDTQIQFGDAQLFPDFDHITYQLQQTPSSIYSTPSSTMEQSNWLLTPPSDMISSFSEEIVLNTTLPEMENLATGETFSFGAYDFPDFNWELPYHAIPEADPLFSTNADFSSIESLPLATSDVTTDVSWTYPTPESMRRSPSTQAVLKCSFYGCRTTSVFRTGSELRHHERTHKRVLCEMCGNIFSGMAIKRHQKSIHGDGQWCCPVDECTFTCPRDDNLRAHILRVHEERDLGKKAFKKTSSGSILTSKQLDGRKQR